MRKQLIIFTGIILTIFFYSCKKDVGDIVVKGNWKISSFVEDNADQTLQFSGYYFEFGNSGGVTAFNGISSQSGRWNESGGVFSLSFPSGGAMTELNNN